MHYIFFIMCKMFSAISNHEVSRKIYTWDNPGRGPNCLTSFVWKQLAVIGSGVVPYMLGFNRNLSFCALRKFMFPQIVTN